MTKSELIARLAQRYPQLVAKDAEYAVKMILDAMGQALLSGSPWAFYHFYSDPKLITQSCYYHHLLLHTWCP